MRITRREFLGRTAIALALPRVGAPPLAIPTRNATCTILDPGDQCALPESIAGYRSTLANATPRVPVLVIPAALAVPVRAIERHLSSDGIVILESGAAFGDEHSLSSCREPLGRALGVTIEAPVDLLTGRVPYVDFRWPRRALVRDFSRVVPIVGRDGEVIATAGDHPVALRRRIARGTLLFLGSPLGPALWAGDAEARRWVLDVLAC